MIAENEREILSLAWNAYHTPLRYQDWWSINSDLPEGMNLLLRIASGDADFAEGFCQVNNIIKDDLQEAAVFFIKQAFFIKGASYYRTMGLNPQADQDQVKEHYRLLMRLFHPDRQQTQGAWTDNFAGRVNQAYNILRKPELRQEYDNSFRTVISEPPISAANTFVNSSSIPFTPVKQAPSRSPHVKYLPYVVMSGVSILSVLFLFSSYFSNDYPLIVTPPPESERATSEISFKTNNLYQPNDTSKNQAELSDPLGDLAEDHESLNISVNSSAETSELTNLADLQAKQGINHVMPVSSKESAAPSDETPGKSVSLTEKKLPEKKLPKPLVVEKPQESILVKTKPSESISRKRSEKISEIREPTSDTPIRVSSISTENNKPTSSYHARIKSTYKKATNNQSPNIEIKNNTEPASGVESKSLSPKIRKQTKTQDISSIQKKREPNFSERELRLLLGRFVSAYERGDLTTLMSLFSEQARAGGKRGKTSIRQDYKKLFDSTHSRRISLSNIVWRQAGNFLRGDGQVRLRTSTTSQQGSTHSSGKVSFEVEQRNGRLFIRGFYHQLGG